MGKYAEFEIFHRMGGNVSQGKSFLAEFNFRTTWLEGNLGLSSLPSSFSQMELGGKK